MSKNLYGSLALILILNFVIKPVWIFGIDVAVQNKIGTANYGNYFALLNLSLIFHAILEMGILNFNNRAVAQNSNTLKQNFGSIFTLKSLLSITYASVVFFVAYLLGYQQSNYLLLSILVLNQIVLSYFLYLRSNISGLQHFKTDSFLSIVDRSFMILILLFLFAYPVFSKSFNAIHFASGQLIGSILAFLVALFFNIKLVGKIKLSFNFSSLKSILKKSLPYASISLLMGIYFKTDAVMIERLLGPDGKTFSGIYAAGFRLIDALNMIPILIAGITYPKISKMLAEKENVHLLFNRLMQLLLFVGISSTVLLFVFNQQIMDLLYNKSNETYGQVFKILVLSFIPLSLISSYGVLLMANNKLKAINIIALSATFLNIIFNFIFIPKYNAIGAAAVTFATQIFVLLMYSFYSFKVLKINFKLGFLIKSAIYFIASLLITWYLQQNISNFIISIVFAAITILVLAIFIKIIDVKEIRKEFKNK